ncbi:MAG: DUF4390 domain-containing protein [Pelistega sp.]|nr:DUF4390 domain-containing protein [Pelistega sp.]
MIGRGGARWWMVLSLLLGLIFALLFWVSTAFAELSSRADFREIQVQQTNSAELPYVISSEIDLQLSDELRNALERGVPLFFTLELRIYQPRQFWFDSLELNQSHTWRVQYNALLRQWRVVTEQSSVQEFSLDASLAHISGLYLWPIVDWQRLAPDVSYEGRMRLKLDTSLLARPFQITAINNSSAWSLSSPWKNFTVHLSAVKPSS